MNSFATAAAAIVISFFMLGFLLCSGIVFLKNFLRSRKEHKEGLITKKPVLLYGWLSAGCMVFSAGILVFMIRVVHEITLRLPKPPV